MNWHTCKSLLNTSGRAVEQFAGCLAKQAKVSTRGQSTTTMQISALSYEYLIRRCDRFKEGVSLFTAVMQVTPIAPPTGCGIRPVPNRNHLGMYRLAHEKKIKGLPQI